MNLKLALRSLRKHPFVTMVAVVSLALGIGANAAIFSIFHQVLIRNVPVKEPERLVNLSSPGPKEGGSFSGAIGDTPSVFSYPMFRDLAGQQNVFTGVAAHVFFDANLAYHGQTEHMKGLAVSGNYFQVLGLQPALGRLFSPADDAVIDEPHGVVLSYDYWRTRFAADPAVLNQTLTLNGQRMTIIGMAPDGFGGTTVGGKPNVFLPMTMMRFAWPGFHHFEDRKFYWAYLFARLKPGITIEQAAAAINPAYHNIINDVDVPLLQHLSEQELAQFRAKQIQLEPGNRGQSQLPDETRTALFLLFGLTALVLLIACANIANLLLARGAMRTGEMAVRLSIGASRAQLMRQLLVESFVLAALGGVASILVAEWTLSLIAFFLGSDQTILRFEVDTTAIIFAAAVSIGTGVLVGIFPALQSTRLDLLAGLKGQSGHSIGLRQATRLRTALATAQIGLAMALLILAGLFTKSLLNVSRVNLGVVADHVVTFRVSPLLNGYSRERTLEFLERVEDAVGQAPGVRGVTASTTALLGGNNWGQGVAVEGFQSGPDVNSNSNYNLIGPDYFRTLRIPLLAGREFTRSDGEKAPKAAIVNEEFAKKFNLGREAVGKRIGPGGWSHALDTEIIGLVQNSTYSDVKQEARPLFFVPYRQVESLDEDGVSFYIRTSLDTTQLLRAIPSVIGKIDPAIPVQDARTLTEQVRQNVSQDRMISFLCSIFAGLATGLAALGLYGVLAYIVAQRTKEIGVRIALGAAPARIHAMVLRNVGWMTLIGGTAGVAAALATGRFAESLLFKLKGHDPVVLGLSIVVLASVGFGAGFLPARRASRIDPMEALRYE